MTFSKKVFVAVLLTTLIVGSALIFVTYRYVKQQTGESFVSRYLVMSHVLGDTLARLDKNTESLMLDAAQVVQAQIAKNGVPSEARLATLRTKLDVTHLFIINRAGKFIRSTNHDVNRIPNVFSFCSKYRQLLTGAQASMATPILHPNPEPKPFKFLLMPSLDRKYLIEVGVRVDFIASTLVKALRADPNITSMSLYNPKGMSFGNFDGTTYSFNGKTVSLPGEVPTIVNGANNFRIFTKVASSHPSCCQCDVAKASVGGKYYYVLESVISKAPLKAVLAKTKIMFGIFGIAVVLIALIFGAFVVRRLVNNIEIAAARVRGLKSEPDLKGRIGLTGEDEVAFLTGEFDHLLDNLEETQSKIVEAEKVNAKVELATQVAHNIKSPAFAIEMLMPFMKDLPENIKRVLHVSVEDIVAMVDQLKKHAESMSDSSIVDSTAVFLPVFINDLVMQKQFEFMKRGSVKVHFVSHCDDKKAFVRANGGELKAIISNLINNAADSYGNQPGDIFVDLETTVSKCLISVTDRGAGIPEEYLKEIGAKRITFKGGNERGIGLTHAFKTVESWGGKIAIESKLGKGTTVKMSLAKFVKVKDLARRKYRDFGIG